MKQLIITISMLLGAFPSFAQIPTNLPSNGLIAFYPFNGNTNDATSNLNNGTTSGATLTNDRFTDSNAAYSFDGVDDYISLNSNIGNFGTGDFTISAWINGTAFPNKTYSAPIFSKRSNASFVDFVTFGTHQGLLEIELSRNGTYLNVQATNPLPLNSWHFVAVTKSTDSVRIFIDGLQVKSGKNTLTGSLTNNAIASIGSSNIYGDWSGADHKINAKLDDIGIWNRALTPSELNAVYTSCTSDSVMITTANRFTTNGAQFQIAAKTSRMGMLQWQTNPSRMGWMNITSNGTYTGVTDSILTINGIHLSNHLQPFRSILSIGGCADTSNVIVVELMDTCVTSIYDTTHVSVSDTLIINAVLTGLPAPNNKNVFKIYPNPASSHLVIDNGNLANISNYKIVIINSTGQTVFNQNITQQQFNIDLSTWSGKGMYFIQVIDSSNTVIETKKILIE